MRTYTVCLCLCLVSQKAQLQCQCDLNETENSWLALTGFALFAEFMRNPCVDAGLIPPLVQLLNCKDQEVLLQTGRALGNICYDSRECWNVPLFCRCSCRREGNVFTFSMLHIGGHFLLFLICVYHMTDLILWDNWKSRLHYVFVTD